METSTRIAYRQPARAWTEALPLGNGRIGAMAWFGVNRDTVDLNEDSLWSGYPVKNHTAKDPIGALSRAREALDRGDFDAAQLGIQEDFTSDFSQAYMPLGTLSLSFPDDGEATEYERFLDMRSAVAGCEYLLNGVRYTREMFVSAPAQALFYRLSADRAGAISVRISLDSPLRSVVSAEDGRIVLEGECPWRARPSYVNDPNAIQYFDDAKRKGVCFRAAARVIVRGGETVFEDGACLVHGADEVEIRFFARTSFAGPFRHPYLEGKEYKNACFADEERVSGASYGEIRAAHTADFSSFMDRMRFSLDKRGSAEMPTDERLIRFQTEKNDPVLYELIFNFGRYLMISASRPGTLAMNLQGIWNPSMLPPWSSNYTININTEMNYWPAEECALGDMAQPLFELIDALRVTGEKTAKDFYGVRGSVSHHNTDAWAMSNPVGERIEGSAVWAFWQMSFGWLCRHLFDHYLYTLDEAFLREKAFPCIRAAARFYLDILKDVDGELAVSPATSPENTYVMGGKHYSVARAAAMSDAIVREVLDEMKASCRVLGVEDEMLSEIESVYPRLRALKIGSKGQILEWDGEFEETEPHHRHTSHLYALHPAHLVTPEETPELADACRKTLALRGDDGTGWSLGWKINFWARLNDGDHALRLLKNQLRFVPSVEGGAVKYSGGGGTYLNLFDAHPPFQIDGNFGATSGIAEMLMRTENEKITLLPALPSEWPDGEITGLCAMNDMRVNIAFALGTLKSVEIEARKNPPSPVKVVYGGKTLFTIAEKGTYRM